MSVLFRRECNYVYEAKALLARYFNGESIRDLHTVLKQKAGYNKDVKHTLETLEVVYDEVVAQLEVSEDIAKYFKGFAKEDPFSNSLADCMLHQGIRVDNYAGPELSEYIIGKFNESTNTFKNSVLGQDDDVDLSDDAFMKELEKQNMSDGDKWNIWNVYKNFAHHIGILMPSILACVPIIEKVYQKYDVAFAEYYSYWQQACEQGEFDDKLKLLMNLNLDEKQQLYVQPSWMSCNSIRLFAQTYTSEEMQMQIGVIFYNDYTLDETVFTKEELCTRLKLLSDASKYEILKLVKKEKMYGSQLAEQLQLTTATISHHISSLSSKGFLMIEKDANRVYYRLNKKQVGSILDQLHTDLLEE